VNLHIDKIEIIEDGLNNMKREFSLIDNKGKKVFSTSDIKYEFTEAKINEKIESRITYAKFREDGLYGDFKARFSFIGNDNDEIKVKEINFSISKQEVDAYFENKEKEKADDEKRMAEMKSEYQSLKERGFTEEERQILHEISGSYSSKEYEDFEHSKVTNNITISEEDSYKISYYVGDGVGLLWSGEIVKVDRKSGNTVLEIYSDEYEELKNFIQIKIVGNQEGNFQFFEKTFDNDDWTLIEELHR
jgi:hypothetical protein